MLLLELYENYNNNKKIVIPFASKLQGLVSSYVKGSDYLEINKNQSKNIDSNDFDLSDIQHELIIEAHEHTTYKQNKNKYAFKPRTRKEIIHDSFILIAFDLKEVKTLDNLKKRYIEEFLGIFPYEDDKFAVRDNPTTLSIFSDLEDAKEELIKQANLFFKLFKSFQIMKKFYNK